MKTRCEIEFTATQSKNRLTAGKTCYQGHLQHNAVLTEAETRQRFAEYCGEHQSLTDHYIDALGEFIAQEIARGNRLAFGSFGVMLKMLGRFEAVNAPFDDKKNAISVNLVAGKELKNAVKSLKPVNVTERTRWHLVGTLQRVPDEVYDLLVADGPRQFTVTGHFPPVHAAQPDEGVWLEDDKGEKIAVAAVESSDFGQADCSLDDPLACGNYWIVVQCRAPGETALVRVRRRIKVADMKS